MDKKVLREAVPLHMMEDHLVKHRCFVQEGIDELLNSDRFNFENYLDKKTLREFDKKKHDLEEQMYDLRAHYTFIALKTAYPDDNRHCLCSACMGDYRYRV